MLASPRHRRDSRDGRHDVRPPGAGLRVLRETATASCHPSYVVWKAVAPTEIFPGEYFDLIGSSCRGHILLSALLASYISVDKILTRNNRPRQYVSCSPSFVTSTRQKLYFLVRVFQSCAASHHQSARGDDDGLREAERLDGSKPREISGATQSGSQRVSQA
jgi:hypothetical protein